jgi:hypothetical protein
MSSPKTRPSRSDEAILSAFRLSSDAKAELAVIRRILDLSTDVAAVQFAIRRAYNHLLELAPMTARSAEHLEALKDEELARHRDRSGTSDRPRASGGRAKSGRNGRTKS